MTGVFGFFVLLFLWVTYMRLGALIDETRMIRKILEKNDD